MAENETWDAIVIGSGLGGLTCAAYLCALGKKTLVLEAHYVAGGNCQAFRRNLRGSEYEFDVGVHYIGECGPDGMITRMLNGLGLAERIVFRPLDPDGYSTLYFPDLTFRVPASWERYRARLLDTFPGEQEALGKVVDTLRQIAHDGSRFQRGEVEIGDLATEAPLFLQWGLRPVTELFAEHGLSQQASAVLLGEQGDYAVRPSKTPTALAAGLTDHYMRGAYYPEGGGQAMAARLVEAIRAYGGEVRTRAPVAKVRLENGRVVGVTLGKTGQEIAAPLVVSNADLKRTVQELVGEEHFAPETAERVRAFRMSLPLFAVYAGLDIDLAALGHPNTNHWLWGTTDIEGIYDRIEGGELPDDNLAYITVTSLRDPESSHIAPAGHTNLQVMTLVPHDYAIWNVEKGPAAGGRYHRDPEYRRRKQALTDRLLETAAGLIPELRDHLHWREAATPVTQERFTHSTGGTSYGIEYATDQMGPARIGYATEIPGLFLCGASTPAGHGIGNVMFSGLRAAETAAGVKIRENVLAGEVLGDRALLPPLHDDWDAWRESH
ncbi:MAG: NAD(P)/FAD-dependent oxidoreductase [Deltaproteobacteria bacterium]|nr:NAD(P)/FAD-dependent oxidoreductase [Deltaproteobacteria bacterium]